MKRLRVGPCCCPACGCDVSREVRAEVERILHKQAQRRGQIGGRARAERLSAKRRQEIAQLGGLAKAASARRHGPR